MYLLKIDYKSRISTALLDVIIKETAEDDGEDILQTVSKIAEDTITTKVGVLYNIVPELSKAGTERNYMILSLALSIAVYELYQRIDDVEVPEKVLKNYNEALDVLDEVSRGKSPLNLPPRPVTSEGGGGGEEGAVIDGGGLRRIGSQAKRSHSM